MNNQGFTLIELLIVIAVISILLTLTIPNLLRVRRNAIKTSSYAYVRSCITTMTNYALDNPEADMVGMSCNDPLLNSPPAPSYLTRIVVASTSTSMSVEYDYIFNGTTITASIPVSLR